MPSLQETGWFFFFLSLLSLSFAFPRLALSSLQSPLFDSQYGWDAISGMPTNLYGPHDNFHPENSHVLPALIRRFHEAKKNGVKEVVCWGTGSPLREFLHVDDLAGNTAVNV